MTTITIQFGRPRSSRLALLAMGLGVSLVVWAEQRVHAQYDHAERVRLVSVDAARRERERAAVRLSVLR